MLGFMFGGILAPLENSSYKLSQLTVRKIKPVSPETRKAVFTYKGENSSHCPKCSMTFNEKDGYLQHLVSFHQRATRKHRLVSAVGEGAIIKDGKFECQFCHKVFDKRRPYNGHVGNHVKSYVKRAEEAPGHRSFRDESDAKSGDGLSLGNSKMDALVEIAQNTMESNSSEEGHSKSHNALPPTEMVEKCKGTVPKSSNSSEMMILLNCRAAKNPPVKETTESIPSTEQKIDKYNIIFDVKVADSFNPAEPVVVEDKNDVLGTIGGRDGKVVELNASDNTEVLEGKVLERPLHRPSDKNEQNKILASVADLEYHGIYEKDVHLVTESNGNEYLRGKMIFPPLTDDDLDAIEELRYDNDETQGFDFVTIMEPVPLGGPQIVTDAPVQFGSKDIILNMDINPACQLTTTCVWCGEEFTHDAPN
ncbi:hypothetical protein MLD38_013688 [Melastoma candidum]|uniref:Uncharacterized protein n=1 Tax=Melastoma candidum TaxID=119954 RepID=A0ACB9RAH2_9MYRT|nr:hypothetical protein MLD38_013688 [Melastoma candidum]